MKIPIALLSLAAAGVMMAQTPAPAQPRSGWMVQRMTRHLGLTADQQTQVKSILKEAREQNKAIALKLRAERQALKSAVESGSHQQIDRILTDNAQMNAQAEASYVKAMSKVYALLTPDQKTKFDQMGSHWSGHHADAGTSAL